MRHPRTNKTIAATAAAVVALLGGGVAVASAAPSSVAEREEVAVSGTVQAPAEPSGSQAESPASEQGEADQLQRLATVTAEQAVAVAEQSASGRATDVRLEEEDGYVVYQVTLTTSSGPVEVIVDAGSSAVLAQEAADLAEEQDGEQDEEQGGDTGDEPDGPELADAPGSDGEQTGSAGSSPVVNG